MRVTVVGRYFMNVEQGLVDALLQLQGAVQGLHGAAPLVPVRLLPNTDRQALQTQQNSSFVAKQIMYNVE